MYPYNIRAKYITILYTRIMNKNRRMLTSSFKTLMINLPIEPKKSFFE